MRAVPKHIILASISAGLLIAIPARSGAEMVTYTETVNATGSLNGSMFSNAMLTVTFVGDTSTVTNPSAGIYRNPTGTATVMVNGMTATLDAPVDVFVNQTDGVAGIETFAPLVTVQNSTLTGYDLKSSIGLLSGTSGGFSGNFATSDGTLTIDSLAGTATFQATVLTSVPEPASLLLMGLGIAGLAATRWRVRPAAAN